MFYQALSTNILLLIPLIATYANAKCRFYHSPEEIYDFIKCYNTTIESLTQEINEVLPEEHHHNKNISLELTNIDFISLDVIKTTLKDKIIHLTIYNNSANVHFNAFNNLKYCSSIHMYGGIIENFSGFNHTSLSKLTLDNVNIRRISNICQNSPNLEEFNVHQNKIKQITKLTFSKCKSLKKLDLSNNRIKDIEEHGFYGLDNLLQLNLTENRLSSITPSTFNVTKKLLSLDIQHNKIKNIYRFSFFGLKKLQQLYLSYNNFERLENNTFYGLSSLEYLNLTNSHIDTLEFGAFTGLDELISLDISNNAIIGIPQGVFLGLPMNSYLYMTKTKLEILQEDQFLGLDTIWGINVSHSNIKEIEKGLLNFIPFLTELDLSYNLLNKIPCSLSNVSLYHLEYLDLSNNIISSIENCTFEIFPNLQTLLLENNHIEYLYSETFFILKDLVILNIANNQLVYLEPQLIDRLGQFQHFKQIEMFGNPWDCRKLNQTLEHFKERNIEISIWKLDDGIACIDYFKSGANKTDYFHDTVNKNHSNHHIFGMIEFKINDTINDDLEPSSTLSYFDNVEDITDLNINNVTVNNNSSNVDSFGKNSVKTNLIIVAVVIIGILIMFVIIVLLC